MIQPKRFHKQDIDKQLFENFFSECGDYDRNNLNKESSPIWTRIHENNIGYNVFDSIQSKDIDNLKKLYEDYYVNGISSGATTGLSVDENKNKRNLLRSQPLAIHLEILENGQDLNLIDFYNKLFEKYKIPSSINIGQTWGWEIGENFVHFEIQDYIYFLDIITKILESYNLNKTCFIGDGSGLMSSLLYENYDIESSTHIDIAHLLLRQYINNVESPTRVKHIYAENFNENVKHDTQILINQDSFPEMPLDSMEKYMRNMDNNNVPFVLSYNIENGITFNSHHIDYRKVILDCGYESIWRFDSTVRPPYVFELFYKGENNV